MNHALACEQKYFKMNPFISLASKLPHMHTQPCNNFVQFCVNNALRRVHFHLSCSLIGRKRNLCMCFLSACRGEKNNHRPFLHQVYQTKSKRLSFNWLNKVPKTTPLGVKSLSNGIYRLIKYDSRAQEFIFSAGGGFKFPELGHRNWGRQSKLKRTKKKKKKKTQ